MEGRSRETDFWRFCLLAVLVGVAVTAASTAQAAEAGDIAAQVAPR